MSAPTGTLLGQCSECCTCPQPTVEYSGASLTATPCGYNFDPSETYGHRVMRSLAYFQREGSSGSPAHTYTIAYADIGDALSVTRSNDSPTACPGLFVVTATEWIQYAGADAECVGLLPYTSTTFAPQPANIGEGTMRDARIEYIDSACSLQGIENINLGDWSTTETSTTYVQSAPTAFDGGIARYTYSDPWTESDYADAVDALAIGPTFGSWSTTPRTAARAVYWDPFDGLLPYSAARSAARYRFANPAVATRQRPGGGTYTLTWAERTCALTGVAVESLEIITGGRYRPTVTIGAPPTGGRQAKAVAVMSSSGGVASIRIIDPGAGYTTAPTVTVEARISGSGSSTGWLATLTAGTVTAISGGSAGNYLPAVEFSLVTGAAATVTLRPYGGIDTITLTSGGTDCQAAAACSVPPRVGTGQAAIVHLHAGTEVPKTLTVSPGASITSLPAGSPGYYELFSPSGINAEAAVVNVRAACQ